MGISVPGDPLDRMDTMIEESRPVMNRTLAECIEMRESARAGELGRVRRQLEGSGLSMILTAHRSEINSMWYIRTNLSPDPFGRD